MYYKSWLIFVEKMKITRKQSSFGTGHLQFFENGLQSPLGQFLAAGTGQHGTLNRWTKPHHLKTHQRYSLVMLLRGSGGYYRNEHQYQCPLGDGDFVLNFPQLRCVCEPGKDDDWNELCLSFKGPIFDMLRQSGILNERQPVSHLQDAAPWIERFRHLLEKPRPTNTRAAARETAHFAAFLLEMLEAATPKIQETANNDWFTTACALLTHDMSRKISMPQIAEELGMNYRNFRELFAQNAGMSPIKYHDTQRQRVACERLVETSEPCWVIARHLGFYDEHHFSNTFKKWMGCTPMQYRLKQHANKR
jgi:AraC-like DNA-binding protein